MTTSSSKPALSMAELMARHGKDIQSLKKGQEVQGIITAIKPDIMMRIDDKTDVMVLEKDRRLHKQLVNFINIGDTVNAVVLYSESENGYPIVTLRRYMESRMWEILEKLHKSGEKLSVTVTDVTKGGLVVEADNGVSGFLPNSHIEVGMRPDELMGKKINASIVELHKDTKKVVFSQKGTLTSDDFKQMGTVYKVGTKVEGVISGITTFGIFVSLPFQKATGEKVTIDGLVHISEVSWENVSDLHDIFVLGQKIEAVVIGIDSRTKRIDLSVKKLTADPFQKIIDAFPVDKKVTGTVVEMIELGLVLDLGEVAGVAVEGLIKKDKIPASKTYEKGQTIEATVTSVDNRKRKVMLTPVLLEKPLMYR